MKLLRIALKQFRQFTDETIEFPNGIIGIVGSNGSGKTTILEAVLFCLFGSRTLRGKIDDVRTRLSEATKSNPTSAKLTFEINQTVYNVERTLSDAWVYVAGESVEACKGSQVVSDYVEKLIGLTRDEFTATFFTEQKGLEFLSGKKGAAERERFIVRMMGYDSLEKIQEILRDDRKEAKSKALGFEASLGSKDKLLQTQKEEELSLHQIQILYKEKESILLQANESFEKERLTFQKIEKDYKEFLKFSQEISVLEATFEQKSKDIKKLDLRQKELSEFKIANSSLLELQKDPEFLENLIQNSNNQQKITESKIKDIESQIQSLQIKRKEQLLSINLKVEGIDKQILAIKKKEDSLSKLSDNIECPTCGQSLENNLEVVLSTLRAELLECAHAKEDLLLSLKDLNSIPIVNKELLVSQKALSDHLIKEKEELAQIQNAKVIAIERNTILNSLNEARELLKDIDSNLVEKRRQRSQLESVEQNFISTKAKMQTAETLLQVARLQKVQVDGQLKTKEELLNKTNEAISLYDQKSSELKSLQAKLVIFEVADAQLTSFRKMLNESIRPRLSELASDFITELTDGRYTEVFIAPDFSPTVYDDGQPKSVISGGETDILHLCVRLALSQMLAERAGQALSLLVLDEVFGSLDEDRRANVITLLERLKMRFDQIIVITHMDDIKDAAEHVIQINYDPSKGFSSAHINEIEVSPF